MANLTNTALESALIDQIIDLESVKNPSLNLGQLTETLGKTDYYTLKARLVGLTDGTVTESHETPLESSETVQSIDRDAMARTQLEALGYVKGEKVFLRFFHPDREGGKNEDFIYPNIPWTLIDRRQGETKGCYFVVNGQGQSYQDEETNKILITKGKAVFYEHDDLPRELQLDLWKSLGLPVPTFQIDTGGKSIHSYWVFNQPTPIADWKTLQTDLLDFSDGDRQIKNPSRVMRLAGAIHIKKITHDRNQTTVISNSGTRYSFDELRSIVPNQKKLTSKSTKTKAPSNPKSLRLATETVSMAVESSNSSIPSLLEIKTALLHVDPDCSYANWSPIGMALHSQDINLLSEWDSWSSGTKEKPSEKYKEGFCAEKWDTFKSSGDINIYKLFQIAKAQNNGYQAPKSIEAQIQQIKESANSVKSFNPRPTDLELEIAELEPCEEDDSELAAIKLTISSSWDIAKTVLPATLVSIFNDELKATGIPHLASAINLLGLTAPLVSGSHYVEVPREDKPWHENLNLFVALIGEPGSSKSDSTDAIIDVFINAQLAYVEIYREKVRYLKSLTKEQIQEFEKTEDMSDPIERVCLFSGGSMECLLESLNNAASKFNSGILWASDELSSIFGGFNKYNKGDDDVRQVLTLFNGRSNLKNTKKDGMSISPRTPISIVGGIQEGEWIKAKAKFSNSATGDGNGFSGRWLLGHIPKTAKRNISFGKAKYSNAPIVEFVEKFRYNHLDRPGITPITIDQDDWGTCYEIEQWVEDGVKATGSKNSYAKGRSYIYRVAGILALWNDEKSISRKYLVAAQAIVNYSIAVDRLLSRTNDVTSATGIVEAAYQLGLRKGKLNAKYLHDAKLGTAKDSQSIIQKVADLKGGTLAKNNRGTHTWTPD